MKFGIPDKIYQIINMQLEVSGEALINGWIQLVSGKCI